VPDTVDEAELHELRNTPVWVYHGGRDERLPHAEAEKTVAALRAHGAPVEYTLLPDGDHFIDDAAFNDPALQRRLVARRMAIV
jgi:dipeptidyl aminopeptidase/acylaminoacyl peptidase